MGLGFVIVTCDGIVWPSGGVQPSFPPAKGGFIVRFKRGYLPSCPGLFLLFFYFYFILMRGRGGFRTMET